MRSANCTGRLEDIESDALQFRSYQLGAKTTLIGLRSRNFNRGKITFTDWRGSYRAAIGIPEGQLLVALVVGVFFNRKQIMKTDKFKKSEVILLGPVLSEMSDQYRDLQQVVRLSSREQIHGEKKYAGKTFQTSNIQIGCRHNVILVTRGRCFAGPAKTAIFG